MNAMFNLLYNHRFFSSVMKGLLVVSLLLLFPGPISASEQNPNYSIISSSQYDYHIPPPDTWTCFDYSMNYSHHNPEWGMVVMSDNKYLSGKNHVVNYMISSEGYLLIHDGLLNINYLIKGWEYDSEGDTLDFYHFYIDSEKPTRHYNRANPLHIRPNAEEVWSRWNGI